MITIAISTDERGFEINAVLIASIVRRASGPVWVQSWSREFSPKSFVTGPLKVEFLPAEEEVMAKYPENRPSRSFFASLNSPQAHAEHHREVMRLYRSKYKRNRL
jgi:hypothetical protein